MDLQNRKFLIIGGAPRSGTTSLFQYLAAHPEVCESSIKETRFFLERNYPLPSVTRFDGGNLEEYGRFFARCLRDPAKVLLEASPDYLYSRVALRIGELMPRARIVFVLRDPADRVISWYLYARHRGLLGKDVTLEAYVRMQLDNPVNEKTPLHMRAIEQGRYWTYLPAFRSVFGDRCLEVSFDRMVADTATVVGTIAEHAGLDPEFYKGFSFQKHNASTTAALSEVHKVYLTLRRRLAFFLHPHAGIIDLLRRPNKLAKKILGLNIPDMAEKPVLSAELRTLIQRSTRDPSLQIRTDVGDQ